MNSNNHIKSKSNIIGVAELSGCKFFNDCFDTATKQNWFRSLHLLRLSLLVPDLLEYLHCGQSWKTAGVLCRI